MKAKVSETENGIDASTYDGRAQLRARWEDLSFALGAPGHVKVRNHSYGESEASEHCYVVAVTDGETAYCTCKADEYNPGPCKHRRAVESQPAVMQAASADESAVRAARGME